MKEVGKVLSGTAFAVSCVLICVIAGFAANKPAAKYVITNNDIPGKLGNSATVYSVGKGGALTQNKIVSIGAGGLAGGFFGMNKLSVLQNAKGGCAFATDSVSGEVAAIAVPALKLAGVFQGSKTDLGTYNGIGLALNAKYVYANFTASHTIGTFKIKAGCKLTFIGDIDAQGLNGGEVDGMAAHGSLLVVTYQDGSIESFDISKGRPASNGDKQNSTGFLKGGDAPGGVDITQDGHFAIFGDISVSTTVEVSDISSGKLTTTLVYHLGSAPNSSSVWLSPDETLLYIGNTQAGRLTAAFFDKTTGTLSKGCTSPVLKGFGSQWAYVGTVVTENTTGTGGVVYAAEYGAPSSIGIVQVKSSGGKCSLKESPNSPVTDATSPGLLSIGAYPPRLF